MRRLPTRSGAPFALATAVLCLGISQDACSDDGGGAPGTDISDTTDSSTLDTSAADSLAMDTADAADTTPPIEYTHPAYFPDKDAPADEVLPVTGLSGPVRVIYDGRGIPHLYGDSAADLARIQGFVTARDRIFQMHTLRMAASGRLAEYAGARALSGDLYLRLLGLRHAAEGMAAEAQVNDPELWEAMTAFADGVNQYIARLKRGEESPPPEISVFGADLLEPWTPADTMTIARLQTFELGFDGDRDLRYLEAITTLREAYAGTARDGIELDLLDHRPVWETASDEPAGGAKREGSFDLRASLSDAFFQRFDSRAAHALRAPMRELHEIPHHAFRGPDYGSNNWVISGAHTKSGKPIVANDTHLALRNPAVFYQIHLSNTLAGGDLNIEGVNFAGAPGIVLGHNDHAAWGATVFAGDVTDVYIEQLNATGDAVLYDGAEVALNEREETFSFDLPGSAATCADAAPSWIANLDHSETLSEGRCALTVTFVEVPHHGPIIPWSFREDASGQKLAASWRWPGFTPSTDLSAIHDLERITSVADFKAALDQFDVGAQNWVAGFDNGDIAWYPTHLMPIRKQIADGDTTYPPFLPMPGETSATNWEGFLPRGQLPQAVNPAKGWLATANNDPTGLTFDNDPFNDGPYIGFTGWTAGFRIGRVSERVAALVARGDVTLDELQAIQADHQSNTGKTLVPALIAALHAARDGDDTDALALIDARVDAALEALEGWEGLGWQAASGVGAAAGSDEAKASIATSIFNAWLIFVLKDAIGDEGLDKGGSHDDIRVFARMVLKPDTMATWSETLGDTVLWDDVTTPGVTETRTFIMVRSLVRALDFLAATDKVGIEAEGGFGTSDMDAWRWGALHTLTLKHNISEAFDIPPHSEWPHGFPRPGDNFCVDAAHPGTDDTSFTFRSGPAIRNVFALTDPLEFRGVIPGGQSESPSSPHYSDEMALWVKNEAPKIPFTLADVLAAKAKVVDFVTPEVDTAAP